MTVSLSPIFNAYQGFTTGGLPLSGGLINTYIAGSTTPQATYTTSTGSIQNSNPIVLGADGRPSQEIWLADGMSYKFVLTDSASNLIGTYDNIQSAGTVAANTLASLGTLTTTIADGLYPIYAGAAGGSADIISATLVTGITAVYNGLLIEVDAAYANATTAPTFNLTLGTTVTGAKVIYKLNGMALSAGDISGSGHRILLAWSASFNGWLLINYAAVTAPVIPTITATVAANALTVGAATQELSFRSATAGFGTVTTITAAPAGLVVPSSATLGTIAATSARLVILELLNAGVAELAIVNLAGGNQLDETNLITTTAISAAATAANVIYSTTARTSVPYRVVGFIDITEATAGTWATAPSTIQGCGGQALAAMSSIGFGQTWQSFTVGPGNQRIFSTTYYNTTGKPIMVTIWQYSYLNAALTYTVNGFTVPWSGAGSVTGITDSVSFIVPPNGSYSANSATGWLELR